MLNVEIFGNILHHKRRLETRIHDIQSTLEIWDSPSLVSLLHELQEEYETILYQEEILWYQKSRERWVHFGD